MKHRKLILTIVFISILSVLGASFFVAAYFYPPSSKSNYTLNASGQAFDKNHNSLIVSMNLVGTTNGNNGKTLNLQVKDGQVNVHGYSTLNVQSGIITLKPTNTGQQVNVNLVVKIDAKAASWNLNGEASSITNGNILISLTANELPLPTSGNPTITQAFLTGKIIIITSPAS